MNMNTSQRDWKQGKQSQTTQNAHRDAITANQTIKRSVFDSEIGLMNDFVPNVTVITMISRDYAHSYSIVFIDMIQVMTSKCSKHEMK